jgi:CDP-glucose 4,6-dehydratase
MNPEFWRGRRVFVTGHTGFKGGWLVIWLHRLGAAVTGYALAPETTPNLFEVARVGDGIRAITGNVRDAEALRAALHESDAEVVFHLAAQSLVRESYLRPVDTYATNVMGTVHLLDAIRSAPGVRSAVIVTSDKCYANLEWPWPYRENDRLGGRDPYSSSKACAELVTAAFRGSFFAGPGAAAIATARAGNVIGGGDWAKDRLVPDLLRAFTGGMPAVIRNPDATRPWQHVLEPVHGYLMLAQALFIGDGFADAWNFGPDDAGVRPVRWVADALASRCGEGARWTEDTTTHPPEAMSLQLDSARTRARLGWAPRLSLETALDWVVEWQRAYRASPAEAREATLRQIARYEGNLQ